MKQSLPFLFVLVVTSRLHLVPVRGLFLRHPIFPRAQCLLRFWLFRFDTAQFDKYDQYFREDSVFTLAQAGEYYGPDGIAEYIKFAYADYSAYFTEGPTVRDTKIKFRGYDRETGNCGIAIVFKGNYAMDPAHTRNDASLDVVYMLKVYFNYRERYIPTIHVFYSGDFVDLFFSSFLNSDKTHKLVCDVMSGPCGPYLPDNNRATCEQELAQLPTLEEGFRVDGNSQGCRALHSIFAQTNPVNHCAHISLTPMEDPAGNIKCYQRTDIEATDLFDSTELQLYTDFCHDTGIDPAVGHDYDRSQLL